MDTELPISGVISTRPGASGMTAEIRRVVQPNIETAVSLCVSDHSALSDAACAVREILVGLVRELVDSGRCVGIRAPGVDAVMVS